MERLEFLRHIKKVVILAMFSDDDLMDRLVLKGGNLLDIVYQLSARASVDVDLSMSGEFEDVDKLRAKILNALETSFQEYGYIVFDFKLTEQPPKLSDDMKDFWGGYRVEFKLIDELSGGRSLTISRACVDKLPMWERRDRRFSGLISANTSFAKTSNSLMSMIIRSMATRPKCLLRKS